MSLLVVGSVAFDALESPYGKVDRAVGGAATYFAVAASFFTHVNLVGIVGDDGRTARDVPAEALQRGPRDRVPSTVRTMRAAGSYLPVGGAQTGFTFSARGPFGPFPSVYSTAWPSWSRSKPSPSTDERWKKSSPRSPVMNPNPLSDTSFLIVPCITQPFSGLRYLRALPPLTRL